MIRYLYTIICIVLCTPFASAQQSVRFDNYSIENGLSQSTVTDICQTKDGFIWFATSDGLNRFDGYNFTVFKHIAGDPGSLSSNYIKVMAEDDNGNLWVGTNEGDINIFNNTTEQFKLLKAFSEYNSKKYKITAIRSDGKGNMWIGTDGSGMARYNIKTGKLDCFHVQNSKLISNFVLCIYIDKQKNIWYGTRTGATAFREVPDRTAEDTFCAESNIYAINEFGTNIYIATAEVGLHRVSGNAQTERVVMPGETDVPYTYTVIMPDRNGNLWVGTQFNGLFRVNKSGTVDAFQNDPLNTNTLCNDIVYSALQDHTGNLWFGTYSGISCIRPLNQQLQLIQRNPRKANSLSNNNIYYTYQDNFGKIWLATLEGGLNEFRQSDQTVVNYSTSNSAGLLSNSIRSIFQDSKNQYWVGTGNAGLFRFYPEKRRFEPFHDKFNFTTTSDRILCMIEDRYHNYWIGTDNGLNFYDAQADTIGFYLSDTANFGNNNIYEIKQDTDPDILIIATFGDGLHYFDVTKRTFVKSFRHDPDNPHSISNNQLMCINLINDDTLLIGTFGGGLNIFNRKTGQFTSVNQQDGLPNDAVYGILRDKKGYIWMSTNKGLSRLDLQHMKFKNFDQINLVQSLEFNEGAYMATREGYFYFGGINGLNVFKPEQIIGNSEVPPVQITGIKVLDKELPFRSILHEKGEIVLKYNQNFISIDFVALNYNNPERTTYAYMLEGIDEDWVMAGDNRTANYTKLPPGNYIFRVKAANEDGIWNSVGASVTITITPPFWKTWWFFTLLGIAALGVIYFALHMRTNAIRRSYQAQMTEVELKALRSQMNPHFIFNSINSIQYYILNKNAKTAYTYLSKFSSLMRMILQNSRINYITIDEEIESLNLYLELENIRLDNELHYNFEIDAMIDRKHTQIPSMVIQPFVENAILHGLLTKAGEKRVTIRMQKEVSHIYCEVEDNGIGRDKARELNEQRTKRHESTGMRATKQRLEILNRNSDKKLSVNIIDLTDENNQPIGTKVQVFIPITNKPE